MAITTDKNIVTKKIGANVYGFKDKDVFNATSEDNANKYLRINSTGTCVEASNIDSPINVISLTGTSGTLSDTDYALASNSDNTIIKLNNCLYWKYLQDSSTIIFLSIRHDSVHFDLRRVQILTSNKRWVSSDTLLERADRKVTTIDSSSTDTQYPSAKCVYDAIEKSKLTIIELEGASSGSLTDEQIELIKGGFVEIIHDNVRYVPANKQGDFYTFTSATGDVGLRAITCNVGYSHKSWYLTAAKPFEFTENKVTEINSSSTNTQYPSAKAVYNLPTILSGTTDPSSDLGKDGDIYVKYEA